MMFRTRAPISRSRLSPYLSRMIVPLPTHDKELSMGFGLSL